MLLLPREGQPGKLLVERQAAPVSLGLPSHGSPSQARGPWQSDGMLYSLNTCGPMEPSWAENIPLSEFTYWVHDLKVEASAESLI